MQIVNDKNRWSSSCFLDTLVEGRQKIGDYFLVGVLFETHCIPGVYWRGGGGSGVLSPPCKNSRSSWGGSAPLYNY